MADEQSPTPSGLTPEQETVVRDLLADARPDEPIPEAVAARLDRVLDGLHEDRTAPSTPVVDLGARRRGKAGRLLLAAAAIVVGGVAVGQGLGGGDEGSSDSSDFQDTSTQVRSEVPFEGDGEADGGTGGGTGAEAPEAATGGDQQLADDLPVQLSPESFDRDVRRLARDKALDSAGSAGSASARNFMSQVPAFACPPAAYGKGTLIPAYYDDQPTVLAFRPPLGSARVAELLRCGTAEKLRSLTLPR